jgi:hypothetical protein
MDISPFSEKDIEAVWRVSAGNPLYIRMLAEDLVQGRLRINQAYQLPLGIEGYFEDILRRLCGNSQWITLRDCLLLLAVSRDYLSVDQVRAITGLTWVKAQEVMEEELQPILIKDLSGSEVLRYQLFHEKFREFLLDLFLGKLPEVASRLNRHFVRQARRISTLEAGMGREHLIRVRQQLLTYCRRWQETGDTYPLLYFPGHLYETDAGEELEGLLRKTDFLEVKLRFHEPEVVEQLRKYWQANSRRLFHVPPDMGRLHKLWLQAFWGGLIFILTKILMKFLATQPEFQPLNLASRTQRGISPPGTEVPGADEGTGMP